MTRRKQTESPRGPSALEDRREQVASLAAKGFSIRQIARALSLTKNQVEDDLKVIRPRFRKVLEERAADIYVSGAALIDDMQREAALTLASIPRDPSFAAVRLQVIQTLLTIPEKRARLGQSLGLILQAPERVEIVERVEEEMADALMVLPPEDMHRIRTALQGFVKR